MSVGAMVASVQLVVFRSEFCCKVNVMEGTVQERAAVAPEKVRLNTGAGVVCEV